ncbi:MAG: HAD family phosphatase [Phycisphaerae bacterium]|nr:HAD family phosphatase [Phycisphaerae bacterium]
MNKKIKNVIFDLGGVLINWSPELIAAKQFNEPGMQQRVLTEVFGHQDWLDMDSGKISEDEAGLRIEARLGIDSKTTEELFETTRASLTTKAETVELLLECKKNNEIFCLSNIHTNNFNYLRDRNEYFSEFNDAVVSSEVKMIKPDEAIYVYALERFGIEASQTVFIDDSVANIQSANKLGITGILFKDANQCRRELVALGVI